MWKKFLREYKYDGIDFDWEFPEGLGDKKILYYF